MNERNPYRRIERWVGVVGNVLLGALIAIVLLCIGVSAAFSFGWWALLFIPGLVVLFVIVGALVWLSTTVQRWWWRKGVVWDRENGAE